MAKTKTPFFSMGSKGTMGSVLTSQKRGGDTILRRTPIPTDPYSLNQAYQRWDYKDYAYQWTLLSNAEKQVYRTTGSRYHITGFSQFMREQLKTLPDLAGRWRLDEKSGAVAYDSSKNNNNGTIIGASPAAGLIDGAFLFDGTNDYLNCGHDSTLDMADLWTIDCFLKINTFVGGKILIGKRADVNNYTYLYQVAPNILYFESRHLGVGQIGLPSTARSTDTWYHIFITYDLASQVCQFYIDNILQGQKIGFSSPDTLTTDFLIGANWIPFRYSHCTIDNLAFYKRILDAAERTRHSLRRYPA